MSEMFHGFWFSAAKPPLRKGSHINTHIHDNFLQVPPTFLAPVWPGGASRRCRGVEIVVRKDKTEQKSIDNWMDKQNGVRRCSGVLRSHEKE